MILTTRLEHFYKILQGLSVNHQFFPLIIQCLKSILLGQSPYFLQACSKKSTFIAIY